MYAGETLWRNYYPLHSWCTNTTIPPSAREQHTLPQRQAPHYCFIWCDTAMPPIQTYTIHDTNAGQEATYVRHTHICMYHSEGAENPYHIQRMQIILYDFTIIICIGRYIWYIDIKYDKINTKQPQIKNKNPCDREYSHSLRRHSHTGS